jgi:hypothetical protein
MAISSLVSFSKREFREHIPGMQMSDYFIPASMNSMPEILLVADSYYYKPTLDQEQDRVFVPSEQIVESLVHMHRTSQMLYKPTPATYPAVFGLVNQAVTPDLLQKPEFQPLIRESLEAQRRWFISLVQMADDDWMRLHNHRMISDIQRTAAVELGLEREWLFDLPDFADMREKVEPVGCPFCAALLIDPNAPICPNCGKVHNPVRLAEIEKRLAMPELAKVDKKA